MKRYDFTTITSATLFLLPIFSLGCNPSPQMSDDAVETIAFVPKSQDDYCPDGCPDREVGACEISRNVDVLLLGRVVASDYVLPPCEDRVYRSGHFEQKVEVLEHLVGTDVGRGPIEIVVLSSNGIAEDVGDEALIGLRNIDGVWFRLQAAPIETNPLAAKSVEREEAQTVYVLPTNVAALKSELATSWADFEATCGAIRETRSDVEMKSSIFDAEPCPSDPNPAESEAGRGGETDDGGSP